MVNVCLLESDREDKYITMGKTGETRNYNGTDYTYYGIADMTTSQNDDGTYNYNFDLRDDIYFSDGERLTADDAIFSLYVILDPSYDGYYSYLKGRKIKGLDEYINGKSVNEESGNEEPVASIEGIKKTGDFSFCITTTVNYSNFNFVVAPLHYYGDLSKYDYDNNSFGFDKGDLSTVRSKTTEPMGAGPYKFVKYENGIVNFEANETYYKGAPKTKYMQFREMTDADKLNGVITGTVDITDPSYSKETVEAIKAQNGGEVTGPVITTDTVDNRGYGYIGIQANNVAVGGDPSSEASKNLRRGIATILAAYREVGIDSYYGDAAELVNYPISNTNWAAPQPSDDGYKVAFAVDVDGNDIYTSEMSADDRQAAAKAAALGFFEAAGYTVADGKVTAAPEGAKLEYQAMIPADGSGDHPSFMILTLAKEAFAEIGINLDVKDLTNSSDLWDSLDAGTAEIWCAAWQSTPDPDMTQVYFADVANGGANAGNSNHYKIADADLDSMIVEARTSTDNEFRKAMYKACLDKVIEWAVEVPVYQRQNAIIFSTERVKMDTVTPDITTFYDWKAELQNIEMAQ